MHYKLDLQQRLVMPIAILAFLIPICIIEMQVMSYTKGVFVYPLDDSFIHMSISKNLVSNNTWGVSPHEFASASSSIAYPLILAGAYVIFGYSITIPFFINLICGIILLIAITRFLRANALNPTQQITILLITIYLVPLPVIVIIGMEHTLQILFCFLFIVKYIDWITILQEQVEKKCEIPFSLCLLGAAVTAIRYEGVFLIFLACLHLVYLKKWRFSYQLGLLSIMPVFIFGFYAIYKGSYFLPNPVLIKSLTGSAGESRLKLFTDGLFNRLYYLSPSASTSALERLIILLPAAYLFFLRFTVHEYKLRLFIIFLTLGTLLHLSFGKTTWFFRYEVYLLAPSVVLLSILALKYRTEILKDMTLITKMVLIFLSLSYFTPLIFRSRQAFQVTPGACINIYGQQYQAGLFLHKYYDSSTIAVNDVGAMSFFTSGKKVDMLGLGNIDFARSIRNHYLNEVFIDSMVKKNGIKIAILSNMWAGQSLFPLWRKVADWHSDKELIIGSPDIFFYAVDTAQTTELKRNLLSFEKVLPEGVTAFYY